MVFRFRDGSRFSGDAEAVALELERIRGEEGALRADAILAAAVEEDAILHRYFPWDDAQAAHEHRLEIARKLPRSIEIVRDGGAAVSMYVHHSTPDEGRTGEYTPLSIIVTNPDRYLQALEEAQRDLTSAQRRVAELLSVARSTGHKKGEVARIMLAVQALQTANDAIHALH
jgi:hypothetical protein